MHLAGAESAPLLVLLRMASGESGLWDGLVTPLARDFRVARFDLPMPTLEALNDPRTAFGALATHVAGIASGLGARRFVVFGWNGGCHVALRCAADHSERVAGCVLLGPFDTPADPRPLDRGVAFLRALTERGDARLYASYWYMAGLSQAFVAQHFDQVEAWVERRVTRDPFLRADPQRTSRWMEVLRRGWIDDATLSALRVPVSIVAPTRNAWHAGPTVEMAQSLARRIPGAQLQLLEGYGSLVPLEVPERVVQAVAPLLDRVLSTMKED